MAVARSGHLNTLTESIKFLVMNITEGICIIKS